MVCHSVKMMLAGPQGRFRVAGGHRPAQRLSRPPSARLAGQAFVQTCISPPGFLPPRLVRFARKRTVLPSAPGRAGFQQLFPHSVLKVALPPRLPRILSLVRNPSGPDRPQQFLDRFQLDHGLVSLGPALPTGGSPCSLVVALEGPSPVPSTGERLGGLEGKAGDLKVSSLPPAPEGLYTGS